ncbi:MAG: site-2 protease family protein [Polyangiaceae bacterium]|nr:site-2 protease family protein [Polyangiaceae bacterium]
MTEKAAKAKPAWVTNLLLFLATVASVLLTGVANTGSDTSFGALFSRDSIAHGAEFAGTLLSILVAHELGHYIAARIHKVKASLPYFIPLPLLSPFGTMGAVIRMRGTIPTRHALLDIGASGPLAGLLFAIPLYVWGVAHSSLVTVGDDTIWFGESILMKVIHRLVGPPIPEGMDIQLSPAGFGAWGGLFVTMINLLPVGQLDGGHVAYALFGPKQDRYARFVHRSMLAFFFVIVFGHLARDLVSGAGAYHLGRHVANSMFWLVWFQVLAILGTLSRDPQRPRTSQHTMSIRTRLISTIGLLVIANLARDHHNPIYLIAFFGGLALLLAMEIKGGTLRHHDLLEHPETASTPLDSGRKAIAIVTLLMFVLLFMPEPFTM